MRESRAVWFTAPGTAYIRTEHLEPADPHEVVVRTLASGISQGTELLVLRGQAPPDLDLDLPTLEGSFRFPIKFGYASVGRVTECGSAVSSLQPGDLVFVHHPHQTEFVVAEDQVVVLPPGTPPEVGTLLANMETAVNVLLDAHPRLGDRVVVFGQGVVGLLISTLLRRAGVGAIIAVEPDAARAQLSQEIGVDVVVSPQSDVPARVLEWTDGLGADIAVEASGSGSALNLAIDCLAFEATLVAVSWYGTKEVRLNLGGAFHRKRLRILSSQVGSIAPEIARRWNRKRRLDLAVSLLSELNLNSLISDQVPFEQAPEAYQQLLAGKPTIAQMVLVYEDRDA